MKKKNVLKIAAVMIALVMAPILTSASITADAVPADCQPQDLIITCNGEHVPSGSAFPIEFVCNGVVSIDCCGDGPA